MWAELVVGRGQWWVWSSHLHGQVGLEDQEVPEGQGGLRLQLHQTGLKLYNYTCTDTQPKTNFILCMCINYKRKKERKKRRRERDLLSARVALMVSVVLTVMPGSP